MWFTHVRRYRALNAIWFSQHLYNLIPFYNTERFWRLWESLDGKIQKGYTTGNFLYPLLISSTDMTRSLLIFFVLVFVVVDLSDIQYHVGLGYYGFIVVNEYLVKSGISLILFCFSLVSEGNSSEFICLNTLTPTWE